MELTFGFLSSKQTHDAMIHLGQLPCHGEELSNIMRIRSICKDKFKEMNTRYLAICKKYYKIDDKGNITRELLPDLKEDDAQAEIDTLLDETFELKGCRKISLEKIISSQFKVSPAELDLLEPLIDQKNFE